MLAPDSLAIPREDGAFGHEPVDLSSASSPAAHPGSRTSEVSGCAIVVATTVPAFGEGLRHWLHGARLDWEVREVVVDRPAIVPAVQAHGARVAIVSDHFDGVLVAEELRAARVTSGLLVLTKSVSAVHEAELLRAGALGVLTVAASQREFVRAVADLLAGRSLVSAAAVKLLAQAPEESGPGLSAREQEVLVLLAADYTNSEIAERLMVAPSTVKTYVSRLGTKLGVSGRRALARSTRHSTVPLPGLEARAVASTMARPQVKPSPVVHGT